MMKEEFSDEYNPRNGLDAGAAAAAAAPASNNLDCEPPPLLQRAETGGNYRTLPTQQQQSVPTMIMGPPRLQRGHTEGNVLPARSRNSLSAAAAAGRAIPVDTDISKEKMKTRLTYFARPKPPVRVQSLGDASVGSASNLGLGGGSFHSNSNSESRRRSNFEEAVANLREKREQQQQQQQQEQQLQQQQQHLQDEQMKLESKKQLLMDGGTRSERQVNKNSDRRLGIGQDEDEKQLAEKRLAAMPPGQDGDEEEVPQIRNWLRDMGGNDEPVSVVPPPPEVEYDSHGRIVKNKNTTLAALGENAPGAYSASPGMQELLDTPENYGRLGVIGAGRLFGSVRSSTKSEKHEKGSGHFRSSTQSVKKEEGKDSSKQPGELQTLEEGSHTNRKGDPVVVQGALQPTKATWWKKKAVMLVILLVVISAVVVVPIVIVLQSNSSSESETVEQQQQKQEIDEEPIKEEWVPLVPNMTNATLAALEDPFSLQSLAYEWIAKDPDWDTYEDWRKQQRFAMMCFYFGYSGDPSNLSQRFSPTLSRHECEWIRALDTCEGSDRGAITKIGAISPNQISFTRFTPEIGFLTHLEEIDFSLGLHMKHLEDVFPLDVIKSLPPIKSLKVDRCELGGSIPSTLGLITSLTSLDLPDTGLVSTIPSQLGLLSDLETLTLSSNALTGSIPKEIGELPSLINFDIRTNPDLEPPMPSGFCMDGRAPFESLITDWCFSPAECCGS